MTTSTGDKIKGTLHEAAGATKEEIGKLTNNPELEAKGAAEKIDGKVQHKVGQVKEVFEK